MPNITPPSPPPRPPAPASNRTSPQSAQPRGPGQATPSRMTDPANEAHFTVEYKGMFAGWFREVSGLAAEIEVKPWKSGGNNAHEYKLPGRMKYPNLVLKAGVTRVGILTDWLFETQTYGPRQSITVKLMARKGGEALRTWVFAEAYVIKWTGPNLNIASNNPAIETLEIAHHGLQRQAAR